MVTHLVAMEYPWLARLAVLQGSVDLIVSFSREGRVTDADVLSGPSPLALPAKNNVSKWIFKGCTSPTGICQVKIVFSFTLLPGYCSASEHCPTEFEMDLPDRVSVKAKALLGMAN